jgi:hypothetical protein
VPSRRGHSWSCTEPPLTLVWPCISSPQLCRGLFNPLSHLASYGPIGSRNSSMSISIGICSLPVALVSPNFPSMTTQQTAASCPFRGPSQHLVAHHLRRPDSVAPQPPLCPGLEGLCSSFWGMQAPWLVISVCQVLGTDCRATTYAESCHCLADNYEASIAYFELYIRQSKGAVVCSARPDLSC